EIGHDHGEGGVHRQRDGVVRGWSVEEDGRDGAVTVHHEVVGHESTPVVVGFGASWHVRLSLLATEAVDAVKWGNCPVSGTLGEAARWGPRVLHTRPMHRTRRARPGRTRPARAVGAFSRSTEPPRSFVASALTALSSGSARSRG